MASGEGKEREGFCWSWILFLLVLSTTVNSHFDQFIDREVLVPALLEFMHIVGVDAVKGTEDSKPIRSEFLLVLSTILWPPRRAQDDGAGTEGAPGAVAARVSTPILKKLGILNSTPYRNSLEESSRRFSSQFE